MDVGGNDAGVDPNACDPGLAAIPGGGSGGGPLNGTIAVFVRALPDAPFEGATVIVEAGAQSFTGVTGADGCIQFTGAALDGRADVQVMAPGMIFQSAVGVNAAIVTRVLVALDYVPPSPETATLFGDMIGMEVLGSTTATVARIAVVEGMSPNVFTGGVPQSFRPGTEIDGNIALIGGPGFNFSDYQLSAATYTRHLLVRAGLIRIPLIGPSVATTSHYGFSTELSPLETGEVREHDIAITDSATAAFDFTYRLPTDPGLSAFIALGMVVMPERDGWFTAFVTQEPSATNRIRATGLPTLSGALDGASYAVVIQASDAAQTTASIAIDVDPTIAAGSTHEVPELPPLPRGITALGRTLTSTVDAEADGVLVLIARDQRVEWSVLVSNAEPNMNIRFPAVPSGLTDPITGNLTVLVRSVAYDGVDLDDTALSANIDAQIRRFSQTLQQVSF